VCLAFKENFHSILAQDRHCSSVGGLNNLNRCGFQICSNDLFNLLSNHRQVTDTVPIAINVRLHELISLNGCSNYISSSLLSRLIFWSPIPYYLLGYALQIKTTQNQISNSLSFESSPSQLTTDQDIFDATSK